MEEERNEDFDKKGRQTFLKIIDLVFLCTAEGWDRWPCGPFQLYNSVILREERGSIVGRATHQIKFAPLILALWKVLKTPFYTAILSDW